MSRTLPAPDCMGGFTRAQITAIMSDREDAFYSWMRGQTSMICEGRSYDYTTQAYVESCGGIAHGQVIYPWDVERFLDGLPVID